MTKIIPRELIKHLEWIPGQENPQEPVIDSRPQSIRQKEVSIDDILKGKTFFSDKKDVNDKSIGLAVALKESLEYVGSNGYLGTMPELIAAKLKADNHHDFWQRWYSVHTEENIGIDKKGRFYNPNEPVLVLVNGGGILTPERIFKAYENGLVDNSARYEQREFDDLLEGKLPDGTAIELYPFDDIKKGISDLPHRFGVVMPYSTAQNTNSGYHQKKAFMENPLVIARAGGIENLEAYYERAKHSNGNLGCYHPFDGRNASVPQGRVLFLNNYLDLNGNNDLDNSGRFVGVSPRSGGKGTGGSA